MNEPLKWISTDITIRELKDYEHNPRSMSKKDFDKLVRSIKEDGYHQRILVDTNNIIIGGHSRKKALLAAGYTNNDTIQVLKAAHALTDDEFKRLNIRDNIRMGDFDFDILANNFEIEDLVDWGLDINLFPKIDDVSPALVKEADDNKLPCELCGK